MQRSPHDIVVFTGAGISASAGLRTYRGPNGLWNDSRIVKASEAATVQRDPSLCWEHWGGLRASINQTSPTQAHRALALAEARLPDGYSLHIVTQNVDGLHTAAGSKNMIEFHGNVMQTRCSNPRCSLVPYRDQDPHQDAIPMCQLCGFVLRPCVVLFGEQIDTPQTTKVQTARQLFRTAGTVLVIGTTLEVSPAKNVVDIKKRSFSGVHTVWVNVQPCATNRHCFKETHLKVADEIVPQLMERLVPS